MKKQFDRFVLTGLLAQGAAGSLFTGEEKLPGDVTRPVTVKVLPPLGKANPLGEKRFIDEVRVLAALAGQPHVVTFYGMGITEGVPWIATEQTPRTLAALLAPTPADPREVARVIEHVAAGLAALHALTPPLLHNRLNPNNILICPGNHYKVTEFGLAAPVNAEPTLGVDVVRYAAPELLNKEFGPPGPATDLYALGHIAYEMALGSRLHRRQFPAVMSESSKPTDVNPAQWQAWHHSIPTVAAPPQEVVRGFPPALGEVIARLMAKPPSARYASAAQLLTDIRAAGGAGFATAPVGTVGALGPAGSSAVPMESPPAAGAPRAPARPATRFAAAAPPPASTAPASDPASFAPAGGNERYFVRLRNTTSGPFELGVLQRMARQGQISRLHQVSTDQRTWKPAASVEGLFG